MFTSKDDSASKVCGLRKKIERNPDSPKYIQTVKGIGYRFSKEV